MEDYLTMEFLNDLEVFEFKPKPGAAVIELFCAKYDPSAKNRCFECAICMDDTNLETNSVLLSCKHRFCYSCVSSYLKHKKRQHGKPVCALCRAVYTTIEIPDLEHLLSISDIINSSNR